ncbi:cell wall / vacuolar inhibitor of fructosidase 1-like [Vicia villosa]|uniref:cell wall / vacuolar inhibitor of fructosidase 1-like n=1 Tax=Vicia villosa TaxID=3911 RepID=UPI00273BB94A|nr:cell wall / vacuolar inhibitor of fructosidase 1-like [Vicia villosa]
MNPLALALILCTIAASHSTIINPQNNNANLIEQTCKKTPKYATCIKFLESDPRSSEADLPGFALNSLAKIGMAANTVLNKINDLVNMNREPAQTEALNSCADRYSTILVADMPKSIAALKLGDPKLAEDGANDAAVEATSCENGFKGKSPLTEENAAMYDAAIITAAIVKQML